VHENGRGEEWHEFCDKGQRWKRESQEMQKECSVLKDQISALQEKRKKLRP